jgi:hypothetical protein
MIKKNKINFSIKSIAFIFSLFLIILESYHQLRLTNLGTDFVSWGLSAMAPIFKIGFPYINYWGINPPGLLMFTALWGTIISSSLKSFHVLYIILLISIVFLAWKILNKFFSLIESLVLFVIFNIFFFSSTVQSQFFPSEINGMVFALIGLYFSLKKKVSKKDFFWASFFFILAGQMKEVFAFTGLTLFPHLLKAIHLGKEEGKKIIIYSLFGISVALLLMIGYLTVNHSLVEYKNVLKFKSEQFSLSDSGRFENTLFHSIHYPKERFIYPKYQMSVLIFTSFISLLVYLSLIIKSKKASKKNDLSLSFNLPKKTMVYSILFFFYIGSTIGYMSQGRYSGKYEIVSILPMILMIALSVKIIFRTFLEFFKIKLSKNVYLIITIFLFSLFLLPKKFFFLELYQDIKSYDSQAHADRWLNLENPGSFGMETYIKNNTTKDDCITAAYGWGIGRYYYYSQRKSCSKYFLINILPSNKHEEYRNELIGNPPKAIIYGTVATDMDVEEFERTVFNFSKVLEDCYKQDNQFKSLYWANFDSEKQSSCLQIGLPNSDVDNSSL